MVICYHGCPCNKHNLSFIPHIHQGCLPIIHLSAVKGWCEAYVVNQVVQIMWLLHIMPDTTIYSSGRPLSTLTTFLSWGIPLQGTLMQFTYMTWVAISLASLSYFQNKAFVLNIWMRAPCWQDYLLMRSSFMFAVSSIKEIRSVTSLFCATLHIAEEAPGTFCLYIHGRYTYLIIINLS